MRKHLAIVTLVMLMFVASGGAWAKGGKGQTRTYTVSRGESCWSIALKVYGKGEQYRLIHRFNDLGPLPHILKAGQKIRLPVGGALPTARVSWMEKEVLAKAPTMLDWLEATRDMGLWKLYKVTTGKGSSAGIQFEDASSLRMRERALLVIYGAAASKSKLKKKRGTEVVVERGTVRGGLASLDGDNDMLIKTPAADVRLRSTSSQVEVDDKKSSIISVYDGEAQVAAQGAKVQVPAGFGTAVDKGKKPRKPRRLPKPPRWTSDSGDAVVVVAPGQKASFQGRWVAIKGARKYRVELARDDKFRFPMVDAQVGAGVLRFEARDLVPGRYHARVAAMDKLGLEGKPSRVSVVDVHELTTSRRLIVGEDGVLEVAGLVRLQLPAAVAAGLEVSVNDAPFGSGVEAMRLHLRGLYTIKFRKRGSEAVSQLKLRVMSIKAAFVLPPAPLEVGGEGGTLKLTLADEKGRPAALPGLSLTAYPGGELPLKREQAGEHTVKVPSPAAYDAANAVVIVKWVGGELGRAEVPIKAPPEAPPVEPEEPAEPAEFSWMAAPVALEGPRPGPGLPARAARPMTGLGVSTFVTEAATPGAEDLLVRLALRGELALLDGDLGLDLDLPVLLINTDRDTAGGNDIGDIRVGIKYLALDRAGVALTPSLRVTAPSGGYARQRYGYDRQRYGTMLEPGVLLEWAWRMLTLNTNQIFIADLAPDFDPALAYAGTYAAAVRLWRLSLVAELDTVFGIQDPAGADTVKALGLGGAVRLHLDRARIGLAGGGGLNEDGQQVMGNFSVGLTLDLGFAGF